MENFENLEKSIEKLLNSKPVYNEPMPRTEVKGFMQKMGKRMESEEDIERNKAVNDFGFNQNSLNIDFIRAFLELQDYCKELSARLDEEAANFQRAVSALNILKKELDRVRLRSSLNSNQIEKMDGSLYRYTQRLEDYALGIAPGMRISACPKGCFETDISDSIGYFDRIEKVRESGDTEDFGKFCRTAMNKLLSASGAFDETAIDFYGSGRAAAVVYANLNKNSVFKIRLLRDKDVPSGHFSVICGEHVFIPRKLMLGSSLIIITGKDPFEESNEEEIRNLRFLNDCGLHSYLTIYKEAADALESCGFRCVETIELEQLAGSEIVRLAEKTLENAVPSGAVSLSTLSGMFDNFYDYFLTLPEDTEKYAEERKDIYPYDCLNVMEKAAVSAVKNCCFPTGIAYSCRLSKAEDGEYDIVDGTNYLYHLTYEHRKSDYERAKKMMKPDGIFVMNGYDAVTGIKQRAIKGWNYYPNFEALWTRDQLIREMIKNGFRVKYLLPLGAGMFDSLPQKYKKNPSEWLVVCGV